MNSIPDPSRIVILLLFEKSRHDTLSLPFEQGICRNPDFPPFEKGGRGGFKKAIPKG
jgi:hypothetical protein